MTRWSSLTYRQAAGLVVVATLGAATVVAGLLDRLGLALAALGLIGVLLFGSVLQLRRRVAQTDLGMQQLAYRLGQWQAASETEQRLHDAVAQEHRTAAERHQEVVGSLESAVQASDAALRRVSGYLVRQQRDQTRELEALLQLFRAVEPRAPMPSSGHWALNPTDLLELWAVLDRVRPKLVLELGSGVSSIWIGYALERCQGRLVSVEHDPEYAAQTRAQLRRHGMAGMAEVRDAPLQRTVVDGEAYQWYDAAAFADLSGVELLLVDGPPGGTGPQARYPALRRLGDRLAPGAAVVLDDADRRDEQEILRRWIAEVDGLHREPATVGHLAVLRWPEVDAAGMPPPNPRR